MAIRSVNGASGTGNTEPIETNEQTIAALATVSQEENTRLSPIGSDKILPDFRTDLLKFQLAQALAQPTQVSESYKYVTGKADALIAKGKVPDKKISPGNLSQILVRSAAQNPKSVAAALYHPAVPAEARYWFARDIIAKLPNKQLELLSKTDDGRTFLRTMCEIVEDDAPAELKNNFVARQKDSDLIGRIRDKMFVSPEKQLANTPGFPREDLIKAAQTNKTTAALLNQAKVKYMRFDAGKVTDVLTKEALKNPVVNKK